MPEDKRKINCWIPKSLYDDVVNLEYENTTQAIIAALERLLKDPKQDTKGSIEEIEGYKQDIIGYKQNIERIQQEIKVIATEKTQLKEDITGYQAEIEGYKQDIEGSKKDLKRIQEGYEKDITGYKENIKALNAEITRLREAFANSPDPVELAEVRAHFEGLQKLLEEKNERIKDLIREIETLNVFAHYFKNTEVKQLEAPAVEKKSILSRLKFW